MMFPPNAFLIGAQRSGTTSLAHMICQHPELTLADPKEPDFFSVNWHRGIDWYRKCFSTERGVLLDASVSYSMARVIAGSAQSHVPRRIFELSPASRFIYIVRDPALRCYSSYWHEVRTGREMRSLRDAIGQDAYYSWASYYHAQLVAFLEFFPLDRFLILSYSDFVAEPTITARRCAEFLDLFLGGFEFSLDRARNQAFVYNKFGQVIRNSLGERGLKSAAKIAQQITSRRIQSLLKRALRTDVPAISPDEHLWLAGLFEADAVEFANLTGIQMAPAKARLSELRDVSENVGLGEELQRN